MSDRMSVVQRSALMASVRQKGSKPEMILRRILFKAGYRYRLHRKDLPGTPDIVFPSRKAVIFVHGCFWHGHDCKKGRIPASNVGFWERKIGRNRVRDEEAIRRLDVLGWRSLTVWECGLKDAVSLQERLAEFLCNGQPSSQADRDAESKT